MSSIIEQAVTALSDKLRGASFDGSAKFTIEDEGSLIIDTSGVRAGDDETEVTLIAAADVFKDILAGDLDPTSAFMSGKLRVEGDMGTAMRLSSIF
ncbi:MAG: SCP2 sterol-binding domain-containing protein [Paracoccaceae bacterium]